ncbi:MAG: DUF6624 domain-containing protein [Acidimicrobiales bacterium]
MDAADLKADVLRRSKLDKEIRQRIIGSPSADDHQALRLVDAENLEWLREVIRQFGWPQRSLVGADGAQGFWLLVQHADADVDFQERCLELLAAAADVDEADAKLLAYLTDRVRIARGDRQVYGTQCHVREGAFMALPIEDEDGVEERREAVGLPPLAEYLKEMAAVYGEPAGYQSRSER